MIGFIPQTRTRSAVHSIHGDGKLGYIRNRNGQHFFENLQGRTIAKILRYKVGERPVACSSACASTFLPPGHEG